MTNKASSIRHDRSLRAIPMEDETAADYHQDYSSHYVTRDAKAAEDRPGSYPWIVESYEYYEDPLPFSFRAYDLTINEAMQMLRFRNRLVAKRKPARK